MIKYTAGLVVGLLLLVVPSLAVAVSTFGASTLSINNASPAATQVGIDLQPAVTAASTVAYGMRLQQTLTAGANNDALTALYINPTFADNSKTGVSHNALVIGSGNVGIGRASLGSRFEVTNATGSINFASFRTRDYSGGVSGSTFDVYTGTETGDTYLAIQGYTGGATSGGHIILNPVGAATAEVGIGTTTPGAKLDVAGTIRTDTALITPAVRPNSNSTTALQLQTSAGANVFDVDTTNSRIGIGTTSPTATLDVKGHIASSQTTAPTASVTGTGYSGASVAASSTDTRGSITATVGANPGTLVVTFNAAYSTAPYCTASPATATAQVDVGKMYVTSSTTALTLNFVATPTGGSETWNYICLQ